MQLIGNFLVTFLQNTNAFSHLKIQVNNKITGEKMQTMDLNEFQVMIFNLGRNFGYLVRKLLCTQFWRKNDQNSPYGSSQWTLEGF